MLTWIGRILLLVILLLALLWLFGPREPVVVDVSFDEDALGDDLDAYLAGQEAAFDDITDGVEKRIIWHGAKGAQTPLSILYIHGFSATLQEIRPVPDDVAELLGANLVYTRLAGHGRGGAAMAEPRVEDWMMDVAEGLAIARKAGERVIIIATSTGATLAVEAALQPEMRENIAGMIFVSPNFGINNPAAPLLTLPAARHWLPLIVGKQRSFTPHNEDHAKYWTTSYPSVAVFPMAALVAHAQALDFGQMTIPALFVYSKEDEVVSPTETARIAAQWGAAHDSLILRMGQGDDPGSHVIMGDIMSPGQNQIAVMEIVAWIQENSG